ncbi:MAG TPA: serine/threonine protein kinase [Nocardioidaceae bacterium]|nr:serine/threonine protein kinase [Nocardioidaceae bacterium]
MRVRRLLPAALAAAVTATTLVGGATPPASSLTGATSNAKRTVMFVGNNWAGTATIADATSRKGLKTINIVPDKNQEMTDLLLDPAQLVLFLAIRVAVGEGNDQFVDDMFTTNDGRYLAVSRPSLADVVWIDLAKAVAGRPDSIAVEQDMDGFRTDHMGVSPDGRRLLVSDSTERKVIEFSMVNETLPGGATVTMGQRLRTFESGDTPHENNYSKDGSRIFHASIGRVYTPGDYGYIGPVNAETVHDAVKADRWLQIVRTTDFAVTERWDMGKELEEAGYPEFSSAVRPVALSPDERFLYAQVSFHHGFVEYDLQAQDPTGGGDYTLGGLPEPATGKVTRIAHLPISPEAAALTREQYVLDSAHHGIAMNDAGTKLCVAGTMSDYAAIVQRSSFAYKVFDGAARFLAGREYSKPYWSTTGPGNTCWISMSGSDLVTVIDYATEQVIAEIPVGDHPQRVREGVILRSIL